ncbi:MAG: PAS domain S-box protein, partial [Mariprofundaceae bacterium]
MSKLIQQLSSMAIIIIASIAILGWLIDHATLAIWLPGIANMTFNTALCFIFIALACLQPNSRWSLAMMLGIGGFAGLSLLQDMLSLNFGIDNLLFNTPAQNSLHPGRMSQNTAIGFLLSSLSLFLMCMSKQHQRLNMLSHSLIAMLGTLALMGISMSILISDIPAGLTHFASISLLTAISFLLLSISLFSIYAKKNKLSAIDTVLHSAVHLMYHLKYPQKFTLVSIIMLVPLAFFISEKLSLLNHEVEDAKLKMIGIEHIESTNRLLKLVPEHRGMLNAQLLLPHAFSKALLEKRAELEAMFAVNSLLDEQQKDQIKVPDEWSMIQQHWIAIKEQHPNAMKAWRLHTEMIALLSKHLRDIGNATGFSYDSNPMVHNLMNAQLRVLPQLFEQIGQLRGQGSGFLAKKVLSEHDQLMLGSKSSEILLLLREAQQLLRYAINDGDSPQLMRLNQQLLIKTNAFLKLSDAQLILDKQLSVSPEYYFKVASDVLQAGYDFNTHSMMILKDKLHNRITDSVLAQYTIKLSACLIILLILYLFWAFYQSIINTIGALEVAVRRVRDGEVDQVTELPSYDEMGEVVGSFNIMADELMKVSSQMRAVVDHTVDGIITIDRQGVIKSFNPAAEAIFNYSADEVIKQNITMLIPDHYREAHSFGLRAYRQNCKSSIVGAHKPITVHGLTKSGHEFPMELSISSMIIDDQELLIGMVRDVTEKVALEKQFQHAQKMEALGALVGGVAHNFNNLLAGIVGKAFLAKRNILKKPQKSIEQIESIEKISQQAADMVKQLLTYAHKDFFRKDQKTALDILIKESYKTAKLGISEDITVTLNITALEIMIICDRTQVQQVLMNMMNNARDAVKSSFKKCISVNLDTLTPQPEFFKRHANLIEGDYGRLKISDTGHGMSPETMQEIFDPFYTTKEVGTGTGLGLSTAFGTVASHGGVIEVDSELGIGTTLKVYLPLIQPTTDEIHVEKNQSNINSPKQENILL